MPWREDAGGLTLHVRATPRAARSAIKGVEHMADGRGVLAIAVAALPSDGAANDALVACLAKTLGVRRGAITLRAGATARVKRLHIAGDGAALARALENILSR